MRYVLFALAGVASAEFSSFLSPPISVLTSKNVDLVFDPAMTCSQCVRGGHNFCELPNDRTLCIKAGDIDGMRKLSKAGELCANFNADSAMTVYQVCKDFYSFAYQQVNCVATSTIQLDGKLKNSTTLDIQVPYN